MNGSSDETANVQPTTAGATIRKPTSIYFLRREGVGVGMFKVYRSLFCFKSFF